MAIPIYTTQDFRNIQNNLNRDYILMNDLDFGNTSCVITGTFNGTLDGNYKKIEYINNINTGIFSGNAGTIKNIKIGFLTISNITQNNKGGLVNISYHSAIYEKISFGTIRLKGTNISISDFGALFGYGSCSNMNKIKITNIYIQFGETYTWNNIGCLVGKFNDTTNYTLNINEIELTSSYIYGNQNVGYLFGEFNFGSGILNINNIRSDGYRIIVRDTANVLTENNVGGIIGNLTTNGATVNIDRCLIRSYQTVCDKNNYGGVVGKTNTVINLSNIVVQDDDISSFYNPDGRYAKLVAGDVRPNVSYCYHYDNDPDNIDYYWNDAIALNYMALSDETFLRNLGFDLTNIWTGIELPDYTISIKDFFVIDSNNNVYVKLNGSLVKASNVYLKEYNILKQIKSIYIKN